VNFSRRSEIAEEVVAAVQRKLPAAVRGPARSVAVHFEKSPDGEVVAEGFPADLLGLFTGPAHDEMGSERDPLPPRIVLYLDNLWDYAGEDIAGFRDEVRLTYLHELGHYLGWDENDIAARGLD
jgi:predicted Zn-dependent protease with MMP-like domain